MKTIAAFGEAIGLEVRRSLEAKTIDAKRHFNVASHTKTLADLRSEKRASRASEANTHFATSDWWTAKPSISG